MIVRVLQKLVAAGVVDWFIRSVLLFIDNFPNLIMLPQPK